MKASTKHRIRFNTLPPRSVHRGSRVWLVTSWLIARLWWGIEMSRLAIFRMLPTARITRVSRQRLLLPPSSWVCDEPRHFCLSVDETGDAIVIVELPHISAN